MRTRTWLAGLAAGAALLAGGSVATAQAAPAAPSTPSTSEARAQGWIYVGTYSTHEACYRDGVNSAYADWDCKKSATGKWQLWVLV